MKHRLFSQVLIGLTGTVTLASLTALTTIATTNQVTLKVQLFTVAKVKVYLLPLSVLKIVEE